MYRGLFWGILKVFIYRRIYVFYRFSSMIKWEIQIRFFVGLGDCLLGFVKEFVYNCDILKHSIDFFTNTIAKVSKFLRVPALNPKLTSPL